MADFCNYCYDYKFRVDEGEEPDINVYEIFETLEPDHYVSVLCEGCNLRAIAKTTNGEMKVMWEDSPDWEDYRDRSERYNDGN